jgi:hypothetical protein
MLPRLASLGVSVFGALLVLAGPALLAGEAAPAALIFNRHGKIHPTYAAQPLHAEGIEFQTCRAKDLNEKLASGEFNVLLLGGKPDDTDGIDAFLAKGGGVLAFCPESNHHRTEQWTRMNEWLAAAGARMQWLVFEETDAQNRARDIFGNQLSYTERIAPPFNRGVGGLLLLTMPNPGAEPPMPFRYSDAWEVIVRGADTLRTRIEMHHSEAPQLRPWIPEEPLPAAPPLMAVREYRGGRLAVTALRSKWTVSAPGNCPTAEIMLTKGAGGKESDWATLFAHTIRWLAEPSLEAGLGGATTPPELLNPPRKTWPKKPPVDWTDVSAIEERPQTPGLIGARTALSSGAGSVAEYVAAAREAGLQYIVFLEDALAMDQAAWETLVAACREHSDESFLAVPGYTYEDAQGNHLYAFADQIRFPKDEYLLPDRRLATVKAYRTRAYFDLVCQWLKQKVISGFWRHDQNALHWADYKLYNSFVVHSALDGEPVDDAFEEYRYWMDTGGCQAVLAFEMMISPEQVAARAAEGWRVVAVRPLAELDGSWHGGAWSFNGAFTQYITQGPRILDWRRLEHPAVNGEWWRPDLWQVRLGLRVASEAGLKSVTIYRGNKGVFRRWFPQGAKTFEAEIPTTNAQQHGLFLVVEDTEGRRAISMEFWNRNFLAEEFYCSDRCNFLGSGRFRTKQDEAHWLTIGYKSNNAVTPNKGQMRITTQWSPAFGLTPNAPTMPVDGRPQTWPSPTLRGRMTVPGEHEELFTFPTNYLISAEMMIGQGNFRLAYDPAEYGAETTRLGHEYLEPEKQGRGGKNAWSSWHRLVPTARLDGWWRVWATPLLMPSKERSARFGGWEVSASLKEAVAREDGEALFTLHCGKGWTLYEDGRYISAAPDRSISGTFGRGTVALNITPTGSVAVLGNDHHLTYRMQGSALRIDYRPPETSLPQGAEIYAFIPWVGTAGAVDELALLKLLDNFGVAAPGRTAYRPEVRRGESLDAYLYWRARAAGGSFLARLPRTELLNFVPLALEGLNDNWSVHLLDRARPWPNHRALPIRDGRAFAQLDPTEKDLDVFVGHPVTADREELILHVAWQERPRVWYIEAHNPTEEALTARLRTSEGWNVFAFEETVELAPGSSRTWRVNGQ